ncbi:MAG: Cobalamin biosynthesis protein CbiG [Thermodesulfobacteriota bacterium]|nr:Cobalamin biosynthesis protein CbiG [Thermodesulfobacteriota bacterium]
MHFQMKTAFVTLSDPGALIAEQLAGAFPEAQVFLHETVNAVFASKRFDAIVALTKDIFSDFDQLVYIAPCGVVVRSLAGNLRSKLTDPAVVVVDSGGRFAVSLLSGHEGGANDLCVKVSNILGAEPVITTATEALKSVIVGIGCRRGTAEKAIGAAVEEVLSMAGIAMKEVRFLASADIKSDEEGLIRAAESLGVPLRFIPSEAIRVAAGQVQPNAFVEEKVGLPAVAEPAALLGGRRTKLIWPRTICNGVTVALARESFSWSASDRVTP